MQIALGAILAAGHPLEVLDRWSWDEVELVASAITAYHAHIITSLFSGLIPDKVAKPGKRPSKPAASKATHIDRTDLDAVKRATERDARLIAFATQMGMLSDSP